MGECMYKLTNRAELYGGAPTINLREMFYNEEIIAALIENKQSLIFIHLQW